MFNQKIKINTQTVSDNRCFIVAEVSANHNKNFLVLKKFLNDLKKSGVDAVKLQAYQADTITINHNSKDFQIDKKNTWSQYQNLYSLYKRAETPIHWFPEIFKYCKKIKLSVFASIFDESNLKLLERLGCPAYKVASPEITDIPLIKKIAKTKKPVILSTGLSSFNDLKLAVKTVKKFNKKLIILKCTSTYPSTDKELNLKTMVEIKKKFKCLSGFSDHTLGIDTAVHSASLGASMLEKHIKPNGIKTVDSFFSINIKLLKKMIEKIRSNERANGTISFKIAESSKKNMNGRRSIYVIKNIKKGEYFNSENIKSIRPSYGLHPKYLEKFLGNKALYNIKKGMRLKWNMLKKR